MTNINYNSEVLSNVNNFNAAIIKIENISQNANCLEIENKNIDTANELMKKYEMESNLPIIKEWRNIYRKVGVNPTKFRVASESLLRRLRLKGSLPQGLHPLVRLCNSFSVIYGTPIAALDLDLDLDKICGDLVVKFTDSSEIYTDFNGESSMMPSNEVSFVDENNIAHARRWSYKQNLLSVIREETKNAIITIESCLPIEDINIEVITQELVSALKYSWLNSSIEIKILSKLMSYKK